MQRTIYLFISLFLVQFLFAQTDPRLKGVEKELNTLLDLGHAAGFAMAVVEGNKLIYTKGFGYRDYAQKLPVDEHTLFAIGSSTKAFTCSLLGQLREEGKLDFNDSPILYVPEFRFFNDELNNQVNIMDLMSHRTGIPRHDFSWYLFPTDNRDSLLQRVRHQEPFTGIREQWYYNNFMFLLQGVIAERITGKSWEDNIRERVFAPLDMVRSNLSIEELKLEENAALGYEVKDDSLISITDYYHIAGMSPAGSINSSVREMANWLTLWINGGKFGGQQLLPENFVTEAISSHAVVSASLPGSDFPDAHFTNYGYGWFLSSYRGHYRVEHGGNIDGFSANVAFFPSDSLGIVVLVNQSASPLPGLICNLLSDRMLGEGDTDWVERFKTRIKEQQSSISEIVESSTSSKVAGTRPSHILFDYTGTYTNEGYGQLEISLKNDSLVATLPRMKLYLRHFHYDVFEPLEVTGEGVDTSSAQLKFVFTTNEMGDISGFHARIEPTIDPVIFTRTPPVFEVDHSALEDYSGEYQLGGVVVRIYIKEAHKLFLFVPGQPEYELISTGTHKFSFKTLEGFKVEFLESGSGTIDAVNIIQPNGTFKAARLEKEEQ